MSAEFDAHAALQRIVDYQKFRTAYEMGLLSHDNFITLAAPLIYPDAYVPLDHPAFTDFQPIIWHLIVGDNWHNIFQYLPNLGD